MKENNLKIYPSNMGDLVVELDGMDKLHSDPLQDLVGRTIKAVKNDNLDYLIIEFEGK